MKRKTRKFLAVMLSLVLACSFSSSAFAENDDMGGTIIGDSTVTNPVFKFVVPSKVEFAFNAFEVGDAGSQITSGDLFAINKSSIPVQMSFDYSVTTATGVSIVTDPASVDITGDTKEMFMSAIPAQEVVCDASGTALTTTGSAITWASTGAAIASDGTAANVTYVLSAATYNDPDAPIETELVSVATGSAVAAFRFKGTINPDAAWAAKDATASVVYSIKGVTSTAYGAFEPVANMQNVKSCASAIPKPATPDAAPDKTAASKTVTKGATSVAYTVDLGSGTLAAAGIDKIEYIKGTAIAAVTTAEYTLSTDKTTLTLKTGGTTMNYVFATAGTYDIKVTFNDTAKSEKNLTLIVQ